jgi:hypothetical protein
MNHGLKYRTTRRKHATAAAAHDDDESNGRKPQFSCTPQNSATTCSQLTKEGNEIYELDEDEQFTSNRRVIHRKL